MAETTVYTRRWFIIFTFATYSLLNAFQWIEFVILPDVIMPYYEVPYSAVTWTSQIFMATFIPLVFPATWLIDNTGLKTVALMGSAGTALGAFIKCFGINQTSWWVVFMGQTIAACAQCFILELPPKISSIWFPASEVSTATSLGVFGNQLGVAFGFYIPPLIIQGPKSSFHDVIRLAPNETYNGSGYPENWKNRTIYGTSIVENAVAEVEKQMRLLFFGQSTLCIILFILVIVVFKDKPSKPANRASIHRSKSEAGSSGINSYLISIKNLLQTGPFVLLILSYGLNVGVYYALSTLLSPLIKPTFSSINRKMHSDEFFSNLDSNIGLMGFIMVVAGLAGSVVGGIVLDKFKKFKLTTLVTYVFSLLFMVLFSYMISYEDLLLDFFFIGALGFFMTGYIPIGFEFGTELTFPESEASSSGLLNCSAQIFGLLVTELCTRIIVNVSIPGQTQTEIKAGWYANVAMMTCLVLGCFLTIMIKENLKRHRAENETIFESQTLT